MSKCARLTIFPTPSFINSFSSRTNWRKIWIRKEYGSYTSHAWVPTKQARLKIFAIFFISCFIYSFSTITHRRKIRVRNEYRSHVGGRAPISENIRLSNFTIFSRFILSPTSSNPIISLAHDYRTLAWLRATILKLVGLTMSTTISRFILILSNSTNSKWKTIDPNKKSMKFLRESEWQSQNILDSPFSQNQASRTSFSEHPTIKKSVLEKSMEALRDSEQQSQNLMDSQFHHTFQNRLPYSHFQKEPIAQSIRDTIQTQKFVTRPISRLDSIMCELIIRSEKILSFQSLTNPYITQSIGPNNHIV